MIDFEQFWQGILNTLQENISEQGFNTWFSETKVIDLSENQLVVKVPTQFIADYLNKNYSELISEICFNLYNNKYRIKFTGLQPKDKKIEYDNPVPVNAATNHPTKLNSNYNFTQFVIGTNNKFAHSASMAVAESPGNIYNPLFLYGESGMGKTHLMQAVGNFVVDESEDKKVFYLDNRDRNMLLMLHQIFEGIHLFWEYIHSYYLLLLNHLQSESFHKKDNTSSSEIL